MEKVKKGLLWFFHSFIWLGILLLVVDIVTKSVVIANKDYILSQPNQRIDLIPGFLGISYLINTNAAFGIGLGNALVNRIVYIVLALIVSAVLITVYVKKFNKLNKLYKACLMMILVGAVGNLIDRVFYTVDYLKSAEVGVVDWIDFYGIWRYVFNIADSSIVIGVIMLIVVLIVEEILDRKKQNAIMAAAKKNETPAEEVKEESKEEVKVEEEPKAEEKDSKEEK